MSRCEWLIIQYLRRCCDSLEQYPVNGPRARTKIDIYTRMKLKQIKWSLRGSHVTVLRAQQTSSVSYLSDFSVFLNQSQHSSKTNFPSFLILLNDIANLITSVSVSTYETDTYRKRTTAQISVAKLYLYDTAILWLIVYSTAMTTYAH
jgi:hypothetical protein